MALTDLKLQKLGELIRTLRMGRDSLMKEGRVDAARIMSMKLAELQGVYDSIARQMATEKQLKEATRQAKDAERAYRDIIMPEDRGMGMAPTAGLPHQLGAAYIPGVPGPVAAEHARVRKRKKSKKKGGRKR
jgi:hypothetical protein